MTGPVDAETQGEQAAERPRWEMMERELALGGLSGVVRGGTSARLLARWGGRPWLSGKSGSAYNPGSRITLAEARVLGIEAIQSVLPHRYPFLLVDRILEVAEDGSRAVGLKNVTINDPFFQGHFPGYPIMPGVLIIEALAQTGGAALLRRAEAAGKLAVLAGVDGFRFRRPVVPGDTLRLEVTLTRFRGAVGKLQGRALVDGQVVAEGEITFALTPWPRASGTASPAEANRAGHTAPSA